MRQRTKIKVCPEVNFSLSCLPADVLVDNYKTPYYIFLYRQLSAIIDYTIYMQKKQERNVEIHTILQIQQSTRLKTHKFHKKQS